jgi:hypothetical protein
MTDDEKDTLVAQVEEKFGILSHLDGNGTSVNQKQDFWRAFDKSGSSRVSVTRVEFAPDWVVAILSKEPLSPAAVQEWTEAVRAPTED